MGKVPFPPMYDPIIEARKIYLEEKIGVGAGSRWYDQETMRTVEQAVGRGVRHNQDWAYTYIVDSSFNGLLNRTQSGRMLQMRVQAGRQR